MIDAVRSGIENNDMTYGESNLSKLEASSHSGVFSNMLIFHEVEIKRSRSAISEINRENYPE